jgi:cell division septum initiation protein DivIVA
MKHVTFFKLAALLGVPLFVLIPCGCRMAAPEVRLEGKRASKNFSASYNEIRLRVRSLVGPLCGEIQESADHIISGTTNLAVQRAALLWKIEGVPAMRAALFQPDPLTAIFDSWVFCNQMRDYFESGPGKESMGEAKAIAVASCQHMEEQINRVAASMTSSGIDAKARAFAREWASDHPIRHSLADRETTLSRALERGKIISFSAGETVATVAITLDDLSRHLEIYSDQLFRQARWEAELFKSDLIADLPVGHVLPLAERAVRSAERAAGAAEAAPKLVADEREAAVEAMQDELTRTIEFVREERIAALELLQTMMAEERKTLVEDIGQISLKVVDHAFWRAVQLIVVLLVLSVLGTVLLVIIIGKQSDSGSASFGA